MLLALGCMDLDLALRIDEPKTPTEQSTQANCALYERWERSNHLSMMVIKTHISQSIRGSIPECKTVKELMGAIDGEIVFYEVKRDTKCERTYNGDERYSCSTEGP